MVGDPQNTFNSHVKEGTPPPVDATADCLAAARVAGAECLAAALHYGALGWAPISVCPPDHLAVGKGHGKQCQSPGKGPWGRWGGKQHRRLTADELRRRWAANPFLNVGIALGPASGVVGIDSDGPGGEQSAARLSGGDLPVTPEFTSGREEGGRRLLYGVPPGVTLRIVHLRGEALAEGLSLLGWGSQTVMPPSRHKSGRRYAWVSGRGPGEVAVAPAPPWLAALMAERQKPGGGPAPAAPVIDPGERVPVGVLLRRAVAAAGEHRNCTGFDLACQLRDNQYSEEESREVLLAYQEEVEHLGGHAYTAEEALHNLVSAFKGERRQPWARARRRPGGRWITVGRRYTS
jgi:hypothetical protein